MQRCVVLSNLYSHLKNDDTTNQRNPETNSFIVLYLRTIYEHAYNNLAKSKCQICSNRVGIHPNDTKA